MKFDLDSRIYSLDSIQKTIEAYKEYINIRIDDVKESKICIEFDGSNDRMRYEICNFLIYIIGSGI